MSDMREINADRIVALIMIVQSLMLSLEQIPGGLNAVNEAKRRALKVAEASERQGKNEVSFYVKLYTKAVSDIL